MDIVIQRMPQTLWVLGISYYRGDPDSAMPHRYLFCLSPLFAVRFGRDIRDNGWLFRSRPFLLAAADRLYSLYRLGVVAVDL